LGIRQECSQEENVCHRSLWNSRSTPHGRDQNGNPI